MSKATDFAENNLVEFVRAQGLTPPGSWYFGLLSAAADGSFTELSGTGYARQEVVCSLANFAGTQGGGTTLASTGTSHQTSNNTLIDFGTSGAAWGTCTDIGIFDASSGGNLWFYLPRAGGSLVINNGDPVSLPIGSVALTLGLTGGMSDYLSNKMIDLIFRAQSYSWPATLYFAAYTAAPSNAGGGTEVPSIGAYARVAFTPSLTTLSGTQSAGSTSASSGTGGQTSNNVAITYPTATADLGTWLAEGVLDASSGGNLLFWASFSIPKSVPSGVAPSHAAGTFSIAFA